MREPLVLVHGGLWEPMDAGRFWVRTGIVAALAERGHQVVGPDRLRQAPNWGSEADALAHTLPAGPVDLVAGSNGCSAALRFVFAHPDRVARLVLAWPATANDPDVDARERRDLTEFGATPEIATALLSGETLRGVRDAELAALRLPVAVIASDVDGRVHQWRTAEAVRALIPGAVSLPSCPEAPRPDFPAHLSAFASAVDDFLTGRMSR